jgi:MFS family permease
MAGVGIGGEWSIGASLVSEDWPEERRTMGAALMHTGYYIGFFLAGINEDRLSPAYRTYQPGANFLNIPIWISGGMDDIIATPGLESQAAANMRRTGFKHVRLEHFIGVHQLKRSEVKLALRWFRQLGGF